MIICSCNVITHNEIRETIARLRRLSPDSVLTPGLVYRSLGFRPKCGGCLGHVVQMIHGLEQENAGETVETAECCNGAACACMQAGTECETEPAEN